VNKETAVIEKPDNNAIVRPLHVLVPLIKKDLEQGREASERAGLPYYQAAGEKMLEAKGQMNHGEFGSWVQRNFKIGKAQSAIYMKLALATTGKQKSSIADFSSLEQFRRDHLGENRPFPVHRQAWHEPVKETLNKVNTDKLNRHASEMSRIEELKEHSKLALQLIDIGFKALATKLHPDKGGSREAMAILNKVRRVLKEVAENPTKFR
jgi:hypothetical protein